MPDAAAASEAGIRPATLPAPGHRAPAALHAVRAGWLLLISKPKPLASLRAASWLYTSSLPLTFAISDHPIAIPVELCTHFSPPVPFPCCPCYSLPCPNCHHLSPPPSSLGSFPSQVSEQLRALPATVPLLLDHILRTLEHEHGHNILPQVLATLEATRSGEWLGQDGDRGSQDLGALTQLGQPRRTRWDLVLGRSHPVLG